MTGVALEENAASVFGVCVRRDGEKQMVRMKTVLQKLADLLDIDAAPLHDRLNVMDEALPPGYGKLSGGTRAAMDKMARTEGIFLDPVYTAKTFAGLLHLVNAGKIQTEQKVVMVHTGGLPALFGYQNELVDKLS